MKFAMVELVVADLETCRDWYCLQFGFQQTLFDEKKRFVLLEAGGLKLALKAGKALTHSRIYFEVEDLNAELKRLERLGTVPIKPLQSSEEGYIRAVFADPAGNELNLFEWTV